MKAIDLFAGAGGFTTGAEAAGAEVLWAANHWPLAVKTHAANHSRVSHVCQDLQQADWSLVPEHNIQLASPCCQGHTHARGTDRPQHDASRSTAWAVVSCAEYHRSEFVVVENVPEFLNWALYPAWKLAMESLGYSLKPMTLDAANFGVAQHRERVFVVCSYSRSVPDLKLTPQAHIPCSTFIDFHAEASWSNVADKAASTRKRVENGRKKYGDRFLVAYYGSAEGGRSLAKPLGTVTTRDRFGLVDGDRMRMLTVAEYRAAMGFPASYWLPKVKAQAIHLLGNAVCPPQAEAIVRALMAA